MFTGTPVFPRELLSGKMEVDKSLVLQFYTNGSVQSTSAVILCWAVVLYTIHLFAAFKKKKKKRHRKQSRQIMRLKDEASCGECGMFSPESCLPGAIFFTDNQIWQPRPLITSWARHLSNNKQVSNKPAICHFPTNVKGLINIYMSRSCRGFCGFCFLFAAATAAAAARCRHCAILSLFTSSDTKPLH